jgi:hypothetical protein
VSVSKRLIMLSDWISSVVCNTNKKPYFCTMFTSDQLKDILERKHALRRHL